MPLMEKEPYKQMILGLVKAKARVNTKREALEKHIQLDYQQMMHHGMMQLVNTLQHHGIMRELQAHGLGGVMMSQPIQQMLHGNHIKHQKQLFQ